MSKKKRRGSGALAALLSVLLLGLCAFVLVGFQVVELPAFLVLEEPSALAPQATPTPAPTPTLMPKPTPSPAPPSPTPQPDSRLCIRVVGDIMVHEKQLEAACVDGDAYEFDSFFTSIAPSIQRADVAIGNLETVFMGEEKPYTGFPKFNTPDSLADTLRRVGFDVLTMANNHAFDHRLAGVERTIRVLEERGLQTVGANASPETERRYLLLEKTGIRLGILAYTDTFNPRPDEAYMVLPLEEERVRADVESLRREGADFILAIVHWGEEYEETQDHGQERDAQMLASAGVDAVLGSHPHVLQGMELLPNAQGDGDCPVVYSMGNFISNQQTRPRDIGVIFELNLVKNHQSGCTRLDSLGYVPTLVYKTDQGDVYGYDVLPVGSLLNQEDHPHSRRIRKAWEQVTELYGQACATPLAD